MREKRGEERKGGSCAVSSSPPNCHNCHTCEKPQKRSLFGMAVRACRLRVQPTSALVLPPLYPLICRVIRVPAVTRSRCMLTPRAASAGSMRLSAFPSATEDCGKPGARATSPRGPLSFVKSCSVVPCHHLIPRPRPRSYARQHRAEQNRCGRPRVRRGEKEYWALPWRILRVLADRRGATCHR